MYKNKVLITLSSIVFVTISFMFFIQNYTSLISLFAFIAFIVLGLVLIYVAANDVIDMTIPIYPIYFLIGVFVIFNLILIISGNSKVELLSDIYYYPLQNFIAAVVLGISSYALVYFSKENALGEGDVWLLILMGFILGTDKLILGMYLVLFSAAIFGILIAFKQKKLKGVRMPLVPFIVFGILGGILLYPNYVFAFGILATL
jgi:prepilin signal peptidase PulO-like enzyme (type II secretory pathway)